MSEFKLTDNEIKTLCTAGGYAPSGGNVQPWKVEITDRCVMGLVLDNLRSSSFLDFENYASMLALGAFAENVLIAADTFGLTYNGPEYKEIIRAKPHIEIRFNRKVEVKDKHPLYSAIKNRVTNRKMYDGTKIDEENINKLKNLTEEGGSYSLKTVHKESEKKKVADILGKADGIRTYHKELFKQMLSEIRWNAKEVKKTKDGIDIETLEFPALVIKMLGLMKKHPAIINTFPRKVFEDQAKPVLIASSHLCIFSTNSKPNREVMFEFGRVLERVWLTATDMGLAFHPWTVLPFFLIRVNYFKGEGFNPEEIKILKILNVELRKVFGLANDQTPLFFFRLSRAKAPASRSLRLGWKEFTKVV